MAPSVCLAATGRRILRVIVRWRIRLPAGLLPVLLLAGCTLPLYTESELELRATEQFQKMRSDVPVSTDAALTRYVNCVARAVLATLEPPYTDLPWEVIVFDDPQVNAFAMPGGHIGIYSGLLKVAANQHQLATVIGHEVAHVTRRHALDRVNREATTQIGVMGAAAVLGGGQQTADLLQMGAMLGLSLPYGRQQESEADRVGLMYMADAGFDPRQSVELWDNMARAAGSAPPEFMSTHPSSDSRKQDLANLWPQAIPRYQAARAAGRRPDCRQ